MRLTIIPRTWSFRQPAGTSRGIYHTRKVWYVLLQSKTDSERWGVGECAPLPDLSCDAVADYEYLLAKFCRQIEETGCIDWDSLRPYPSILFGLETAFRHYETGSFLLWDTPFARGEAGIPINGLIWMGDYEQMLRQIETKMAAGFRCIKLKIGAIRFDEELALIRHIRNHYSANEIELRVDANGAFTPQEALTKLNKLAELDIHSIEQPIRNGQWTEMAQLVAHSPLPIALDEELIGINDRESKQKLLDTIRPSYIVLKPSLHGGMRGCEEWIEEAEKRDIQWWVTSALETNVGLNAIAQWCAQYENPLPQGLGTGQLFTDNVELPLVVEGDCLWWQKRRKTENMFFFFNPLKSVSIIDEIFPDWNSSSSTLTVQTSGSTGIPKVLTVRKQQMAQSALFTCAHLNIKPKSTTLLCLPLEYIAGKMVVVRALVAGLNLLVNKPSGNPLRDVEEPIHFAAMTPMQVFNSLQVPLETERLRNIDTLLIGGGAISHELAEALKPFPNAVYSTYGMTETLSHIALRRLSGEEASLYYTPFPSVKLSLSSEGTLVIDAPLIADELLYTNDIAEFLPDGRFRILGRRDNVINSGGVKLQIEVMEEELRRLLTGNFAVTSLPDIRFGERVVLLVEKNITLNELKDFSAVTYIKEIITVTEIPQTPNGKTDRAACKRVALVMKQDNNK